MKERIMAEQPSPPPAGEVYDWYRRGTELLDRGDAAAAAVLLSRAVAAEPVSHSLREALARAQYACRDYEAARENFAAIVAIDPSDDYAHFGLGLTTRQIGDLDEAVEHLALAVAMRPDNKHYRSALNAVRVARQRAAAR
jgi:tetratricopeptide (TPR) repeat protein